MSLVTPCSLLLPVFPLFRLVTPVTPCYPLFLLVTPVTPCYPLFPLAIPVTPCFPFVTPCSSLLPLLPLVTPCSQWPEICPLITTTQPLLLHKKEGILHFDFVQPQKVNAFEILAMVCTAVYDINFYLWCCSSKLFSMEMKNFGKTWGKYLLEMETQNFFSYNEIP